MVHCIYHSVTSVAIHNNADRPMYLSNYHVAIAMAIGSRGHNKHAHAGFVAENL